MALSDGTRGNKYKLKYRKSFCCFISAKLVKDWKRFPREVVKTVPGDNKNLARHVCEHPALGDLA